MLSVYRQTFLEEYFVKYGNACHYCDKRTRINYMRPVSEHDDATIDHIIPRSKGGTSNRDNLTLACNACNGAKADRSYEDFIADPRPYPLPLAKPPKPIVTAAQKASAKHNRDSVKVKEHPAYKARSGTLAAAINSGEVTPHGEYRATPSTAAKLVDFPYNVTVYCLTGKRVPKRSEIFDKRV